MAAKFGGKNTQKVFDAAKKASEKQALTVVKMIDNADLIDNPANGEDISFTADLESSIKEIGFVDPLDVTTFGQPDGKYMIVSGHRRRATGVKLGMDVFPCIVHTFTSEEDMENTLLYMNNYRDTAKDPLLFMRRALAAKSYLERKRFSGSIRKEIARRLGLSAQQTDRYLALAKIITPVLDLVSDDSVSISSVQPLACHSFEEQSEIYEIMKVAMESGTDLTRDVVKRIVDAYCAGRKSWAAVLEYHGTATNENDLANGLFANASNPDRASAPDDDDSAKNRNDEIRRERDEIAEEYDKMDADEEEFTHGEDVSAPVDFPKEKKSKKEKEDVPASEAVMNSLSALNDALNEFYEFDSNSEANNAFREMQATVTHMLDEMHNIAKYYGITSDAKSRAGKLVRDKLFENEFIDE